jgi:uncharacterized membrane-anchored protein YitT (DUF2179 family)
MPFSGAAHTVVNAHLYGALGGLGVGLLLRSRSQPQ